MNNVPKSIIEYAQHRVRLGDLCLHNPEERLKSLRENALNAIQDYRDFKKECAKREKEKEDVSNWLKSVGHEIGK